MLQKSIKTEKESADFGSWDENGFWSPPYPCSISPLFIWPPQPKKILNYIFGFPGYIWPKLMLYILLAIGTFFILESDFNSPKQINALWILLMYARNLIMIFVVYGGYHLFLYILRVQGTTQKYDPMWQSTKDKRFMFKNQVYDNVFRSCIPGAIIWTIYEVFYVWAYSNNIAPQLELLQNPIYFVVLILVIPLIKATHFFLVHRVLHWKPLMRHIHSIHHKNKNPGPWSGLAMHPIEHVIYFSALLVHFVIPSHPIHFLLHSLLLGLTPAAAHIGFEGPIYNRLYPTGNYYHYLHHRYISCNYGLGTVPLDKWFGSYFGGQEKYVRKKVKK